MNRGQLIDDAFNLARYPFESAGHMCCWRTRVLTNTTVQFLCRSGPNMSTWLWLWIPPVSSEMRLNSFRGRQRWETLATSSSCLNALRLAVPCRLSPINNCAGGEKKLKNCLMLNVFSQKSDIKVYPPRRRTYGNKPRPCTTTSATTPTTLRFRWSSPHSKPSRFAV